MGGLWNHWLKTSALNEAYSLVKEDVRISIFEDTLILLLFLRKDRLVNFTSKQIYTYNCSTSTGSDKIISSGKEMKRYVTGAREVLRILQSTFTREELFNMLECPLDDYVLKKIGYRIEQSLLTYPEKIDEIIEPIIDELSKVEVCVATRFARFDVPFGRLAEWEKLENLLVEKLLEDKGTENYPRQVSFLLNMECNLHCEYCCQNEYKTLPHYSDDEIYERFNKALTYLESFNEVLEPNILGGEPTLWSDYLIQKIVDRLKNYKRFNIYTNGTNTKSLWYKIPNAYFVTHITDWETNLTPYIPQERDFPTIIVTHQNIDRLEDYLKINTCKTLALAPCTDNRVYIATNDDVEKIKLLATKYNLHTAFAVGDSPLMEKSILAKCNKRHTIWQVMCAKGNIEIASCCKDCKYIPLEKWTPKEKPNCTKCTVRM